MGETIPVEEVRLQAEANGYTDDEIRAMLEADGLSSADEITIPPQGELFGELWAVDNTVSSAKNPSTPNTEPLDPPDDFLALQEPIALDRETCHPAYVEDGEPLSAGEAVERYVEERRGENTSAERHGFERGRQWHDRRNYARGKEMDRQLLEAYENPTTALLSLRVERPVESRITLLEGLSDALESTLSALRYRLGKHTDSYQWMCVLAGTRQYATPHAHVLVWTEGDVPRDALVPVVERFVESCEYAPSSGRGNLPASGAIRIRGTEATDTIPRTEDGGSAGATYALSQLAHLPPVDEMDYDERLWASTVRGWDGGNHFRKSSYDVWGESEPEVVEDFAPNTVPSNESRFVFTEVGEN
ncbi:hypothetical protein [Halovenus sp. HT40]|uniref:hypothetical protein n=1 Tax=Halovenus sp. HT40 TaxID=3126691 RepID=UPI00300F4384